MTIQDSYKVVIAAEIRAQKMYAALAKSFANPETQAVFTELVLLEKNHETKVRRAFAKQFPGVELQDLDARETEIKGVDLSDPKEVLEFAIRREELAENIYRNIAAQSEDGDVAQQMLQFAHEEEEHKALLLTEIQRLHGAAIWFDTSELTGLMED